MELINQRISYNRRVLKAALPIVVFCMLLALAVLFIDLKLAVLLLLFIVVIAMIWLSGVLKQSVNWMERITVNENDQTCHLVLLQKDEVFMDLTVPVKHLRFELINIGRRGPFYQLSIYLSGKLIFTQGETKSFNKKMMQAVIKYFHPDDKMANAKFWFGSGT